MKRFFKKISFNRYWAAFAVFVFEFVLGFSILPLDYTSANNGADAGDFLAAILSNGIPHPTGYPTYLLFGKFAQLIPTGTPYFKTTLLSLIFSSLACAFLTFYYFSAYEDNETSFSAITAIAVGITLGTAPLFLSQAVIVEVHGLQSFFMVCALLWLCAVLCQSQPEKRDALLMVLSLAVGLGAGNHIMIFLLSPAFIYATYNAYKSKRYKSRDLIKYFLIIAVIAILVYATLPFKAKQFPPLNWGNPQTWEGFLWLVSGSLYHGLTSGIPFSEFLQRIGYFSRFLVEQFRIPGVFIGILGMVKIATEPPRMKWVYGWMFLSYALFSINYQTNDSLVYLIPLLIVFSIWIGIGIRELWINFKINPLMGKALVIIFFLVLAFRIPKIRQQVDPRQENSSGIFAQQCLTMLPENAILITEKDADTFPIWYYHFGLKQRPDIHVIVKSLLIFDWYRENLSYTYPDLSLPDEYVSDMSERLAILNSEKNVCTIEFNSNAAADPQCICPAID